MSDVLLIRIAEAVEGLRADLKGAKSAPAAAGATAGNKAGTATAGTGNKGANAAPSAADAAKTAAAAKAAAAAKTAAAAAAAAKGPAAGTKGPGGKFTVEQVRDLIRKVATDANLGKQSAADILMDDGGGVAKVTDLKPENYDAVAEACQVLLSGEGGAPAGDAPEDDLM